MTDEPEPIPIYHLPRQLPGQPLGHCAVCGAGLAEFVACEQPDCHWVRDQQEDAA